MTLRSNVHVCDDDVYSVSVGFHNTNVGRIWYGVQTHMVYHNMVNTYTICKNIISIYGDLNKSVTVYLY